MANKKAPTVDQSEEEKLEKGKKKRHTMTVEITDMTGTYRGDAVRNLVSDGINKYLFDTGRAGDFDELSVDVKKAR